MGYDVESRQGRKKLVASPHVFFRPWRGLGEFGARLPSDKSLGYFRASLRDGHERRRGAMSDELPKGWAAAKLDDVVSFALGGDWGKEPDEIADGLTKVRVVRGTDFKNWRSDKGTGAAERCIKVSSLEKRRLRKDDLVLEVSGGGPQQPVGRTILIDDEALTRADAPLVCSNFFRLLRLHEENDARFVSHFLSYAYARGKFN